MRERDSSPMGQHLAVPVITGNLSLAPRSLVDSPSKNSVEFDLCSEHVDEVVDNSLTCFSKSTQVLLPPVQNPPKPHLKQMKPRLAVKSSHRALPQKEFNVDLIADGALNTAGPSLTRSSRNADSLELLESFPGTLSMISLSLSEESSQHMDGPSILSAFKPFRSKPLSRSVSYCNPAFSSHWDMSTLNEISTHKSQRPKPERREIVSVPHALHDRTIDVNTELDHTQYLDVQNPSRLETGMLYPASIAVSEIEDKSSEPIPYQVHKRILGWKLTSIKRRKDLIDILDIIHNPDDPRLKLQANILNKTIRNKLRELSPEKSVVDQGLKYRQADAVEKYLSRSLKSRQSFKSQTAIKSLMEEKRKSLRSQKDAISRDEYEELGDIVRKRSSSPLSRVSSLSKNDKMGMSISIEALRDVLSSYGEIGDSSSPRPKSTCNRAQSPLHKLYDFPVNIHKPRDRMVGN